MHQFLFFDDIFVKIMVIEVRIQFKNYEACGKFLCLYRWQIT